MHGPAAPAVIDRFPHPNTNQISESTGCPSIQTPSGHLHHDCGAFVACLSVTGLLEQGHLWRHPATDDKFQLKFPTSRHPNKKPVRLPPPPPFAVCRPLHLYAPPHYQSNGRTAAVVAPLGRVRVGGTHTLIIIISPMLMIRRATYQDGSRPTPTHD